MSLKDNTQNQKSMRIIIILLLLSPFLQNISAQNECLNLIWSDEFDGTGAPDSETWGYDLGNSGWGNNEIQNYTSSTNNAYIGDGILTIEAIKTGNTWTSARLKSQGKKAFRYGKIEFRAKLPEGSGTWPALWMLGENFSTVGWPNCGEIDIMEHIGRQPGIVHGSLHSPSSFGGTVNTGQTNVSTFASEFHTYAIIWTEDFIKFLIDEVQYYVYAPTTQDAATWPFGEDFFFIINIAMGGNWGSDPQYETGGLKNGIDPALTSAKMEVDYVRVYELSGTPEITGENFIAANQENVTFSCNDFSDATYEWNVPEGVEIISGAGTNEITVNWGDAEGSISVDIIGNIECEASTATLDVFFLESPVGDLFIIDDFEDGNQDRWDANQTGTNDIELTESSGEMKVDYDITDIDQVPFFEIELNNPINFSQHPNLQFDLKIDSDVSGVGIIVYMVDAFGVKTNKQPFVVPVNTDGNYHTVNFDFTNKWLSNFPETAPVDSSKVRGLEFYLNTGNGTFWMDNMQMEIGDMTGLSNVNMIPIAVYPNPSKDFIILSTDITETKNIVIYDISGKTILSIPTKKISNTIEIDIRDLSTGIYFLKVMGEDGNTGISKFLVK